MKAVSFAQFVRIALRQFRYAQQIKTPARAGVFYATTQRLFLSLSLN